MCHRSWHARLLVFLVWSSGCSSSHDAPFLEAPRPTDQRGDGDGDGDRNGDGGGDEPVQASIDGADALNGCEDQPPAAPTGWARIETTTSPSPREQAAMTYDCANRRLVLHGGYIGNGASAADTWVFQDGDWTELVGAGPSKRRDHAMVFDSERNRVVLFGGYDDPPIYNDTWELGPDGWEEIITATQPDKRQYHAMVYDPERGVTVLFGGLALGSAFQDTWEYDGSDWTQVTGASPPPRRSPTMVYDPEGKRILLFGGEIDEAGVETGLNDLWQYDGSWSEVAQDSPPEPRWYTAAAWHPGLHALVMYGGFQRPMTFQDTQAFDGERWEALDVGAPDVTHASAAAWSGKHLLVFGGKFKGALQSQLWGL
jgi:hypothetical protein